jgi:hypothetical protein
MASPGDAGTLSPRRLDSPHASSSSTDGEGSRQKGGNGERDSAANTTRMTSVSVMQSFDDHTEMSLLQDRVARYASRELRAARRPPRGYGAAHQAASARKTTATSVTARRGLLAWASPGWLACH